MGKALSGELYCPCDRSCFMLSSAEQEILNAHKYKYAKKLAFFQIQISQESYFSCSKM